MSQEIKKMGKREKLEGRKKRRKQKKRKQPWGLTEQKASFSQGEGQASFVYSKKKK